MRKSSTVKVIGRVVSNPKKFAREWRVTQQELERTQQDLIQTRQRLARAEEELLAEVRDLRSRFESAARLQSDVIEITNEITRNWRRELAYQRADFQNMHDEVYNVGQALDTFREVVSDASKRMAFRPFAYLGDHVGLATAEAGFRIFVDTRDRQIAPHLATVGIWESWNTSLLQALLRSGDTVVEVGANFGFFTILAAKLVGDLGKVCAFEANPALVSLLNDSVQINGFANRVDIHAMAATDSLGEVDFTVYENFLGDGHIRQLHGERHNDQRLLRVPADTLDNQLQTVADVRLLRLDAEGAEPAILRGAQALIARSPRLAILMEWGLATAGLTAELYALTSQGFTFHIVQHDGTLRKTSPDALAAGALCDVLCYRGDSAEFARSER
jgi:FkbM family methyltransferase